MLAKFEKRDYEGSEKVWVGKYRNLHNISHWHMENELICCQAGSADVMLDDWMFRISAGECIFCASGKVHYIDAAEDSTLLVCLFNEKLTSFAAQLAPAHPVFRDDFRITERLRAMRRALRDRPVFFEKKTEAMICEMMVDIFRAVPLTPAPNTDAAMDRYKLLLNRIDTDYEFICFQDAAQFMHFSDAYFSKYFKRQAGMTFSQYLNVVRIEKAVELLTADPKMRISDIAMRCGFATIRSFNREFSRIVGYTPRTLPPGYSLNTRSVPTIQETFDPTMESTILLKE